MVTGKTQKGNPLEAKGVTFAILIQMSIKFPSFVCFHCLREWQGERREGECPDGVEMKGGGG